jgi:hypothetical protein
VRRDQPPREPSARHGIDLIGPPLAEEIAEAA